MDHGELLARSELFSTFDRDAVDRIAAAARSLALQRNDEVFSEGDQADELYVVKSGRIAIAMRSPDGRQSVVALMEEGDLFGEMSFFDGGGRSADARALEPAELVAVPFAALRAVLEERPEALWTVVRLLAGRLRVTDAALADTMFLDVTGRTAKRLLEMAGEGADEFTLPVTQEELAGMVGASRERVNKAIAAFIRLGWLEQNDRRYRITDRVQLSRRAT
ncbi:MAG TPA: Crp/Fnr family transcriptional regulator [Acidimicrobiales bacterium]|nr:Crp/Fnr family transcriptional regulator [Acidimicrobiales bacterium]